MVVDVDAVLEARLPILGLGAPDVSSETTHFPTPLRSPAVADLDPLGAFRLDDRVAIVTGASAGLGDRFARVLDAAGARVVVAARRVERLEALAAELRDAHVVACDLSTAGAAADLVAATLERYGTVDVVVNNAGVDHPEPALEVSLGVVRH